MPWGFFVIYHWSDVNNLQELPYQISNWQEILMIYNFSTYLYLPTHRHTSLITGKVHWIPPAFLISVHQPFHTALSLHTHPA